MLSGKLALIVLWFTLTVYTMAMISVTGKQGVELMSRPLKLGFSAFMSLFLIAVLSGALLKF